MNYDELTERVRSLPAPAKVTEHGSVTEADRTYPLFRIDTPGKRTLLVTSGFHGEEPAGPITLALHLPELVREAAAKDVALRVYPCVNPSGFEARTRYNQSDERPNNDFLRYEVAPDVWRGELNPGETPLRVIPFNGGPKETRALREDLALWRLPAAALDIHQDRYLGGVFTYAYSFGDKDAYRPLMRAAAGHATVAASTKVDESATSDADGLIELCDGSITDFCFRAGIPYVACLETTTAMHLDQCHAVNLIWLRGFIELAARSP